MKSKFFWGVALLLGEVITATGAERRKDAAEEVQEGSVANWMEYYKRERGIVPATPKEHPNASTKPEKPAVAPVK